MFTILLLFHHNFKSILQPFHRVYTHLWCTRMQKKGRVLPSGVNHIKKLQQIQEKMEEEKNKVMKEGIDLIYKFESLQDIQNYFTKNLGLDPLYENYAYVVKALMIAARQRAFELTLNVDKMRHTFYKTVSYHLSWFDGCIDKTDCLRVDRPGFLLKF